MIIKQEGTTITVERPSDDKLHRSVHGLTRTLLHNMVVGVTEGFKKELDVNGVGYRVAKEGTNLVMNLGFSHPVSYTHLQAGSCRQSNADSVSKPTNNLTGGNTHEGNHRQKSGHVPDF